METRLKGTKRWLCSKLKKTRQDKNGFWWLQLNLRNLKRSKHKSNCQRLCERCSRSKISVSFLCNVCNPVLCLSVSYLSLFFDIPISNSDFKLFFFKFFSFILVRCAQPRASSVMVEKRVLTSLLALKLFELLFFASALQKEARSFLKLHLNFIITYNKRSTEPIIKFTSLR